MEIVFPLKQRNLIRGCAEHKAAGLGCAADYQANYEDLFAPISGSVFLFSEDQGGNWISIKDFQGRKWQMAHLSQRLIKDNDNVVAGQKIGITGNTGKVTTGPHLHIQVLDGANRLDPVPLLANAPLVMAIDTTPYENKFIRIGITPLRYGYVLRGKKYEYSGDALGVLMALDKQHILSPLTISPDDWNQIPQSNGLSF